MDQNVAALVPLLPSYFGWNLVRTKCLAGPIIALIKVRTVNFMQLATEEHRKARERKRRAECDDPRVAVGPGVSSECGA